VAIGRRIRHIRGADLTQENFARVLGVGQTQLSRYELGQSAPTLNILLRLKIYSRKSIDWILLGEGLAQSYRELFSGKLASCPNVRADSGRQTVTGQMRQGCFEGRTTAH